MKKWQYRILARIKGKVYLIWTYSRHFEEIENTTRKQKRILEKARVNSIVELMGLDHSQTAVQWVLGIRKALLKENHKSNSDVDIMKDGLFNPHYRLNSESYPNVWFKPEEVERIYFEMYLLNQGEQPKWRNY